ncbi:MAG: 16S rRNA (cytosine(1402)-N(4))-methyltransferase RsmH [Flavobacteriaceae bacterium]|nr:16S rRNA (cytosine(1402)-N(4))-methyltransferase RsmH [Flavobacteriaceae bacterium]
MMETNYHKPVLLKESVDGLEIKQDGVYVDVTFGGGGHSRAILERLGAKGKLIAFDQDEAALANAIEDERFTLINENFRYLRQFLKFYGIQKVDGVLADFGVSSHQFDDPERGFSTRFDKALDMRMSSRIHTSAQDVLNTYSEADLKKVFWRYGELKRAAAMAKAVIASRETGGITTTDDLKKVMLKYMPRHKENKIMAQIFQAIRIEVNQELEAIKEFLLQTPQVVSQGGRVSLISYHSLEDRLVKRFIRTGKFEGEVEKDFYGNPLAPFKGIGKMIQPSTDEIAENNRARSARLRIAERL